jgi:hypothetical protein
MLAQEAVVRAAEAEAGELEADYHRVFTTLADLWDDATPHERREPLSKVIKRIDVEPGTWANPDKARIVARWFGD